MLSGANGAGKTNILEAISLLVPGRGLRRATYEQMVQLGAEQGWAVAATLETHAGPVDLGSGWGQEAGCAMRQARINRTKAPSMDQMLDYIRLGWLTPAMDGLFVAPAAERRRFLDRLTLSLDPDHNRQLNAYEKAMRQRNKLLAVDRQDPSWLDAIEAQMALHGSAIICARQDCVAHMRRVLSETFIDPLALFPQLTMRLQDPAQAIQPFYDVAADGAHDPMSAGEVEDVLIDQFKLQRDLDRAAGRALVGPHRSDMIVTHAQKNMSAHLCSTGEQKGLLMRLVLAHAGLVKKLTGIAPILLLDEVGAHLDEMRRVALFDLLDHLNVQAFMTGTERRIFANLGARAIYYRIHEGQIEPDDVNE